MEHFVPFIIATVIILTVPGPTVILLVSQAVSHGRSSVLPLVAGVLLGDVTCMTLSLAGLGAVLSASSVLFSVFKWGGALYLMYLGIRLWRANPDAGAAVHTGGGSPWALLRSSYFVTALNPKGIAFFVAFLPQFVDPARPVYPQLALLGGTFLILAVLNATAFAFFASRIGDRMRRPAVRKWFNRIGGGTLFGAGIFTARMNEAA